MSTDQSKMMRLLTATSGGQGRGRTTGKLGGAIQENKYKRKCRNITFVISFAIFIIILFHLFIYFFTHGPPPPTSQQTYATLCYEKQGDNNKLFSASLWISLIKRSNQHSNDKNKKKSMIVWAAFAFYISHPPFLSEAV